MSTTQNVTSMPTVSPKFEPVQLDLLNWHAEHEAPAHVNIFDLEKLCQGEGIELLKESLETAVPFYIKNFGIAEKEVEEVFNKVREFFKHPEEEKRKMAHKKWPMILRGYSAYGTGAYENNIVNGRSVNQYCKYAWGPSENIYPDDQFERVFQNYIDKISKVTERVLYCIGKAMDLLEDQQWRNLFDGEETVLHCQCYYPEKPLGKERMIAHADASSVTLLNQLPAPSRHVGLKAEIEGKFVGIPPIRGTIVVMTGESLNALSQSRIKPVIHAVTGPATNVEQSERSSMPFFYNPKYAFIMKCPPETMHEQFYDKDKNITFADFANNIHTAYEKVEKLRKQGL